MSKSVRSKALWEFLESTGALDGTDEQIKTAKRAYRKQYFLTFKKQQRSKRPEYTIGFHRHNGEHKKICHVAKRHQMTVPSFIKSATLAYIDKNYLVPDPLIIAHLEQLLSDCLNEIKSIVATKEKYFWQRDEKIEAIEKRIIKLEEQMSQIFKNPPLISSNDRQNQVP